MATVITAECINCGACEPECPNTAIYQGGVEWELNGATHAAIAADIFYIVPEKCTECVGFHDQEACAAVCPVDCCIPDPKIPETEGQLIARARTLHPEATFTADFPSRFRKTDGAAPAKPTAAAVASPPPAVTAAAAPPTPAAAPPPKSPVTPAPVTAVAAKSAAPPAPAARVEKAGKPPIGAKVPKPVASRFPGELGDDFEELLARLQRPSGGSTGFLLGVLAALAMPLLGALPDRQKRQLGKLFGAAFNPAGATALNVVLDFLVYPIVFAAVGAVVFGEKIFSLHLERWVFYGFALATLETAWRLREGLFAGVATEDMNLGPALYGPALVPLVLPFTSFAARTKESGTIAFDGFYDTQFDEKRDRQRRYGDVYELTDVGAGYLLKLELPQRMPVSSTTEARGGPGEMPDYDLDLLLSNRSFVVRGHVVDPAVRKVASGAPSFPPDFTTRIDLDAPVAGFKHRYRAKTLEVILMKQG